MKKTMRVYRQIARKLNAIQGGSNEEWQQRHREAIDELMETAPSGSGFDGGTDFLEEQSSEQRLVFRVDYHHLNGQGYYDGWSKHYVIVRPSLAFGFTMDLHDRPDSDVEVDDATMDYIFEVFHGWLDSKVDVV